MVVEGTCLTGTIKVSDKIKIAGLSIKPLFVTSIYSRGKDVQFASNGDYITIGLNFEKSIDSKIYDVLTNSFSNYLDRGTIIGGFDIDPPTLVDIFEAKLLFHKTLVLNVDKRKYNIKSKKIVQKDLNWFDNWKTLTKKDSQIICEPQISGNFI